MKNRWKHIGIAFAVALMTVGVVMPRAAQALSVDEAKIKVGYLYNFMKFVEWPAGSIKQDYIVCVLGSNPFGNIIESLGQKTIKRRGIRVVTEVQLEQTKYCHVVFVSRSESGRLMPALLRMRRLPILTVSDIEGFSSKGGVIELMSGTDNDISFRVSQKTAQDVGLNVSSKLLSMSR